MIYMVTLQDVPLRVNVILTLNRYMSLTGLITKIIVYYYRVQEWTLLHLVTCLIIPSTASD